MNAATYRGAAVLVVAVLCNDVSPPASAQDRGVLTRDDAVLVVDGVVREVFQSARRDRTDFVVQIEVKRSEAVRSAQTPVRVLVPAPGDFVYVHASGRAGEPVGLGQVGAGRSPAEAQRVVPAERSLVRAYLTPQTRGGWQGAGNDWFDLSSNQPLDASPADPPPLAERSEPSARGENPATIPPGQRGGRSALLGLGLTGETMNMQGHVVIRVTNVDAGGPAQHAGIEQGDVIVGVGDKPLEGIDQLDALSRKGGSLSLVVLDVNSGKAVRVPVELAASDQARPTDGQPPSTNAPNSPPGPGTNPVPTPSTAGRSLGISAEPVQVGARTAMKVTGVHPGSPAAAAGIEPNDVIVAANGVPITGADTLSAMLRKSAASITLTVRDTRTGRDVSVEVKLSSQGAANPAPIPADAQIPTVAGRKLGAVTEMVFYDIDPAVKVNEVEAGSPAAVAGIVPGTVIVAANGKPVLHPKELEDIVRNSGPKLMLTVVDPRTRNKSTVEVRLGDDR
jgi:S1-C subfamily serine protease